MNIQDWLMILGIPAAISAFWAWLFKGLLTKDKERKAESRALKSGLQALLRAQMINDYNKWAERGYAPIYARENFENCWRNYEALGLNGVMNDIHDKFRVLPVNPVEKREKG